MVTSRCSTGQETALVYSLFLETDRLKDQEGKGGVQRN